MEELRVPHHPVLGDAPEKRQVTMDDQGQPGPAKEGEPIAAALLAAGIRAFRKTVHRHEPRGVFCSIGRCTDCMMIVNGLPNVRTCVTPVEDGMRLEPQDGFGHRELTGGEEE